MIFYETIINDYQNVFRKKRREQYFFSLEVFFFLFFVSFPILELLELLERWGLIIGSIHEFGATRFRNF